MGGWYPFVQKLNDLKFSDYKDMSLRCHEVKADNTNIVVIAACVIRYQYKINFIMKGNITMKFSVDSSINRDCKLMNKRGPSLYPFLVSSPKEELLACRETAWLGCFLNISKSKQRLPTIMCKSFIGFSHGVSIIFFLNGCTTIIECIHNFSS